MKNSIIDLHCDLLSYLNRPNSDQNNTEDIGCAIPYLKEGNVKLQVMAIFASTESNSHQKGIQQSEIFKNLWTEDSDLYRFEKEHLQNFGQNNKIGILASLENASAFCDEDLPLNKGFENLEKIIDNVGNLFYIGLTHHLENRFGGGNFSKAGLKDDGRALIDFLDDKNIAIDFSHTSDALAYEMLNYISQKNLNIPILASHSNFRQIFDHPRNLPDDIVKEIINRKGLIGLNFVRAFVNNEHPEVLFEHLNHGLELGGENTVAYGADFFFTKSHPDKSRIPFYHKEHENSAAYIALNEEIQKKFGDKICKKLSHENALDFLNRLWK
ncbi:MAG: dipeptidase [Flavobacterium sp.]